MGFGDSFIRWVRLFYTDRRLQLHLCQWLHPSPFQAFPLVRQGCPCPPFCIFSPWTCWLLTSAVILILLVCASLVFLLPSLYCPCMLITRPPFRALIALLERSSRLMAVSNKPNLGKLEGVWLGSWGGRLDAPVPIKWTTAFIKFWVFILAMVIWRRKTGGLELTPSRNV